MTRLQEEVLRKLHSIGCTPKYDEPDGSLKVEYDGTEICTVMSGGQIHYKGSDQLTEEQNEAFEKIEHQIDVIKEYLSAYDSAQPFDIEGIQDYRKLSEFNGVVFGAKDMGEHGFQFSSWFKTYGGTGATMGNYSFDYEYSKKAFALRSGLVERNHVISDEQLENLYRCLAFTRDNNDSLTYKQEGEVGDLMCQIELALPYVKDNPDYQYSQDEDNGLTLN